MWARIREERVMTNRYPLARQAELNDATEDENLLLLDDEPLNNTEEAVGESVTQAAANTPSLDATQLYLNEIGYSPLLTAEEEVYFSRRAQAGDAAARARMIESNLRLVVKIARRYLNRG